MPTVAEQLEKTRNLIEKADEVLRASRQRSIEIQTQIDAARKKIGESLDVMRRARVEGPE